MSKTSIELINEKGNKIDVNGWRYPDGVTLQIIGPNSRMAAHITPLEAVALRNVLMELCPVEQP